jgi:DNA topoisomerase-3
MIGIIFEKPSAMRDGIKAFGGQTGSYKGQQFKIVSSVGHIYGFDQDMEHQVAPHLKTRYTKWDLAYLPWDYKDIQWKRKCKNSDVAKRLSVALKECDEIVIATDMDKATGEGGLIAEEIITELGFSHKKISRMVFYDEEPDTLRKAFEDRKVIPNIKKFDEYLQAMTRSVFDFLTMQYTRIAGCLTGHNLRAGRLKSIIIKLVVSQTRLVKSYVRTTHYENRFVDENGVVYKKSKADRYTTEAEAISMQQLASSPVISDGVTMRRQNPPKLLDLSSLGGLLSKKNYKVKDVGKTYQLMYEAKYVSYPRTSDSTVTTPQFEALLPHLDAICNVIGVDPSLVSHRLPRASHIEEQAGHGANRPGTRVPKDLNEILSQFGQLGVDIYTTLARSYLAMCSEDYIYEQHKGHLQLAPEYTGTVNIPKSLGYKKILLWDNEIDDGKLGIGTTATAKAVPVHSTKPSLPTIDWLKKQLEKYNVGTGATKLSTIADLVAVPKKSSKSNAKQLLKEGKGGVLIPTEYGELAYDLFLGTHIEDTNTTAELLDHLLKVKAGVATGDEMWQKVAPMVRRDIEVMTNNYQNLVKEGKVTMSEQYKQVDRVTGIFAPTGEEISFKSESHGHKFTQEEIDTLLSGGELELTLPKKDGSGTYEGILYLGEGEGKWAGKFGVQLKFPIKVPNSWCKRTFTQQEKDLLEQGEEIYLEGYTSNAGKPFNAFTKFNKATGRIEFNFNK